MYQIKRGFLEILGEKGEERKEEAALAKVSGRCVVQKYLMDSDYFADICLDARYRSGLLEKEPRRRCFNARDQKQNGNELSPLRQ